MPIIGSFFEELPLDSFLYERKKFERFFKSEGYYRVKNVDNTQVTEEA